MSNYKELIATLLNRLKKNNFYKVKKENSNNNILLYIRNARSLTLPNMKKIFIVYKDASNLIIGGAFIQISN